MQFFRDIFDKAPIGMAVLRLDGGVLQVNEAFCRILRGEEKYFLSRDFQSTFFFRSKDDLKKFDELLAGAIPMIQREQEYVYGPGFSIWVVVSIASCRDERGNPSYLIAQIQDISEYKRLEQEKQKLVYDLKERVKELTAIHYAARLLQADDQPGDQLLQQLVSLLPAAWEHADIAGARISFDGVAYETPGFSASGLTQRASFTTAGGKNGTVEIAYREARPDRTKAFFLTEENDLLDSIAEMLKLYLDRAEAKRRVDEITKQLLERNRELWSLQQEMGRVEQRAALGWMTGAIAHELGTPLNSVLGYTQLLAQEELPEKAQRHLKTITSQVQRIAGIVQYYLERTRGSTSKRSQVNLNELISETLLWLNSVFAEKNVRVVTNLDPSLPLVNAHAGSLQRVLINLLNNAVASIRDEGEITVATRAAPASEHHRPGIKIEVSDTGVGIPADLLPRVFDLFMTTRPQGGGTGLGLAVSQEIVNEHGGKITISSQIHRGTTVTVFLPAGPQSSEPS
jgi:PAS domain S-box-containing protein